MTIDAPNADDGVEMGPVSERGSRPKLVVALSENWTMIDPRDLAGLVTLATAAEAAGADGVLLGEHVAMGANAAAKGVPANPRDWLRDYNQDPRYAHPSNLELLGAMASVTRTLRLLAVGLLAPLRHPLDVAKQLATLDLLSSGRLVVMPTTSWQEEEYAALGLDFHRRGEMLDEHLAVWEGAWREDGSSFDGRHYRFADVFVEPKPFSATSPAVWIGGLRLNPRALRRVVRYGAGWFPTRPPSDEDLALMRRSLSAAGRSIDDLEIVMWLGGNTPFPDDVSTKPLDPALDAAAPHFARGVSTFVLKPSQYIDDPAELGDLCRATIAGLRDRAVPV